MHNVMTWIFALILGLAALGAASVSEEVRYKGTPKEGLYFGIGMALMLGALLLVGTL